MPLFHWPSVILIVVGYVTTSLDVEIAFALYCPGLSWTAYSPLVLVISFVYLNPVRDISFSSLNSTSSNVIV